MKADPILKELWEIKDGLAAEETRAPPLHARAAA